MIDDIANRVRPARAGILTDRVHAGAFRRTIIILGTFDFENRFGSSTSTTAAANISARAYAYHGAYRMRR